MGELSTYRFPARPSVGVLFGLTLPRLSVFGVAAVVLIVVTSRPTLSSVLTGGAVIVLLVSSAAVKVSGRTLVDWTPIGIAHVWGRARRHHEFYASPDLADPPLPEGVLDLPGGLFGFELHAYTTESRATCANPTPADYGILVDTFRDRMVAVVEVSGQDLLFCDPDEQQARFAGWGGLLDHVGQTLPELCRLQLVHVCSRATAGQARRWHTLHGGRGGDATADSYRQLLDQADGVGQQHRLLLAIALDRRAARRAIRQAGGGRDGAATVLLDRAVQVEQALAGAGIEVHGWLPARHIAAVLRVSFDPAAADELLDVRGDDVTTGGGCDPAAAGPAGMVESWASLRLDSGWAVTLQVAGPPSRPVTGEFLQHLLIGVPAARRMSLLYVPTEAQTAERRAQTQQVTAESEQALRVRWGFAASARHRRSHGDAAQREADLIDGRAVFRLVWTLTVTGASPAELDTALGQVEAAARRCGLELRRLVGTQRQAASFTLPLCRGAR